MEEESGFCKELALLSDGAGMRLCQVMLFSDPVLPFEKAREQGPPQSVISVRDISNNSKSQGVWVA